MLKNALIFFLLFLLSVSFSTAAVTSQATADISNSPVKVVLVTTDLKNNRLTVKAKVSDKNGYEDIENVEVKVKFGDEIIAGYEEAVFDSGNNIEALYVSSFDMDETAQKGTYTAIVKAEDKESLAERKTEFIFPKEKGMITGAFVRVGEGTGFLSRLFSWIKELFS